MMLAGPETIKENIEYTRQNVEWQIKRIYRARNAIVHTGSSSLPLPQLTQHLHCYLVKTIHSVLADLDRQPQWRIKDALEHQLLLFSHVVALFRKSEGHTIALASLLDPEACLAVQAAPFAWQPPVATGSSNPAAGQG